MTKLLTPAKSNAKTAKQGEGYRAAVLHLAPYNLAGVGNVCPWATQGCAAACLNTSGRSAIAGEVTQDRLETHPIHSARIRKTRLFMRNRISFMAQLDRELGNLARTAAKQGLTPIVRLNATSDIAWEGIRINGENVMQRHPTIQFYDYTKSYQRAKRAASDPAWPSNYHLTLSRSEAFADGMSGDIASLGINVAVVFSGDTLPETFEGAPVIDGTAHDWRFEDPRGVIVGLLPKGRASVDTSGFVVQQ